MVDVAAAKNKMDARKWLTSKMYPRVYGDHVEHQHVGDFQPAILIQVSGSFLPQYQEKKLVAFNCAVSGDVRAREGSAGRSACIASS